MNCRDPLIKGGQGRDEEDLMASAVVVAAFIVGAILIGIARLLL
jgi:hypothetical protein